MNRRYSTKEFEKIVERLRNYYEDVILTTDIIVGFPGENEKEFERTYEFLKKIKFYKMHIFKYSPREGTKAAKMEEQVDGKIKEERSKRLIALSKKNEIEYNKTYIGKEIEVLIEEKKDGEYIGHTKNYILAHIKSSKDLENKTIRAICDNIKNDYLVLKYDT